MWDKYIKLVQVYRNTNFNLKMEEYFSGLKLYGNDFKTNAIKKWYQEEAEGYSNLSSREIILLNKGIYLYENVNLIHGYKFLDKNRKYKNVLGIGSATGHEFLPIIDKIENLYILEPSDKLQGNKVKEKRINYVKPEINGEIKFEDDFFDLITCFGVLHHIPNVSFIISEVYRVLKKDGVFLLREPIVSMGDWRYPRPGLTKNERGIPVDFLRKDLTNKNFKINQEHYCFTLSSFFSRITRRFLKKPIYAYRGYVLFDKIISQLLKWNIKYHTTNKYRRVFPQSVYFVIRK